MTQPLHHLVADVGGTNTRLALARGGRILTESLGKFTNADHDGLDAVIGTYLAGRGVAIGAAAVAIAGPVHGGHGRLTNLDWEIDETGLAGLTGAARAAVLNDLAAQAHGLGHIDPGHLQPVIAGTALAGAPQLVIGAGTGFNAALALTTAGGRVVTASECGHATLPVRRAEDLRLVQFLEPIHGFTSVEDVLSGRGVAHLDRWLAHEAGTATARHSAEIMEAAAAGETRATDAVATYVRLLGAVAGDLALTHLPFGGVFLIGGMARAMAPHFDRCGFASAFADKGRFTDFMGQFPVSVIADDFAALAGLAAHLDESDKI